MTVPVVEFMEELVTQPRRQMEFRRSAEVYASANGALTSSEREALASGDVRRTRDLLTEHSPVREVSGNIMLLFFLAPDEEDSSKGVSGA
ncbi:hypothetical protein ACFYO0_46280 [Streptomyces sp. NPDC006365]|uniref:hypothetical protein n=1 Tax=Streptomyces sp. NPDC006365 TaxID=3364744 RepID=UPI0036C9D3B9